MSDSAVHPVGYNKLDEEQLTMPMRKAPSPTPLASAAKANETHDDMQLMMQVMESNSAALEILYDRYASAVMGLTFKMLGDRTLAEEVTHETFWRVWRNAHSFRSRQGKFSSWLFGIARNLSIDAWRRQQVRPQQESSTLIPKGWAFWL
jgi:hypothetical protein